MRLFVLAILLIGCATTPRPEPEGGPRGLRASEHLDAARDHDQMACERETWPDLVPELQRRAARDLEAAAQLRSKH